MKHCFRKMVMPLLLAVLVGVGIAGTAVATSKPGKPTPGPDVYPAVLWIKPDGSTTVKPGAVLPFDLSFKNSEPFPGIQIGYVDSSGQHYSAQLSFTRQPRYGYQLEVPNWPDGKYKAQSITISGYNLQASSATFGVHMRNKEYVGIDGSGNYGPYNRSYNVDFTKIDLTIKK